jgi:phytoene dehydrogenase-like protein
VIIGSGIGGLCCGALLAALRLAGAGLRKPHHSRWAAHSFQRQGYTFDSGPSCFRAVPASPPPIPCAMCWMPLAKIWTGPPTILGRLHSRRHLGHHRWNRPVGDVLRQIRGDQAVQEWRSLQQVMARYGEAATALPAAVARWDWGILRTLLPYFPKMLPHLPTLGQLTGAFGLSWSARCRIPSFANGWICCVFAVGAARRRHQRRRNRLYVC